MAKNSKVVGGLLFNISASTADFDKKMRQMQKKFDRMGKDVSKVGAGITTAFAPAIAAVTAMSLTGAAYAKTLDDVSQNLQISASALQTLRMAADEGGASTEKLEAGIRQLVDRTVLAAQGNKEYAEAIQTVGYTTEEFMALPVEKRMEALGVSYNNATNKAEAHEAIMRLLGNKSGPELIKTLKAVGEEGFEGMATRAKESGLVLDDVTTKNVADFMSGIDAMKTRLEVLGAEISGRLISAWERLDSSLNISDTVKAMSGFINGLSDRTKDLAVSFGVVAAASGPAVFVLGKLMSLYSPLIGLVGKARVALAALTATTVADTAATTANTAAKVANAEASGLSAARIGRLGAQAATVAATAFFTYEATKGITEAIIAEAEGSGNKQKQIAQTLDEQAMALEEQFGKMKSISELSDMRQNLADQYAKTADAWAASSGKERDQLALTMDALAQKRLLLVSQGEEIVKQNEQLSLANKYESWRNRQIEERRDMEREAAAERARYMAEEAADIQKKYLENKFSASSPDAQAAQLRARISELSGGLGSKGFEASEKKRISALPYGDRAFEATKSAEIYNEIFETEQKLKTVEEGISDEQKKQFDLAEETAKKLKSQQDSLLQIVGAYDVLRLRAIGQEELASAVEAELKLREEIKNVMDATGLSEQEAEKRLREKLRLENAIAGVKEKTGVRETREQRAERKRQEREEKAADPIINLGDGTKKRWGAMDSGERDKALERYRQGYAADGSIRPEFQAKSLVDSMNPDGSKGAQAASLNPRVSSGAKSAESAQAAAANTPKENKQAGQAGGVENLLSQLLGKFDTFTSQFTQAFST